MLTPYADLQVDNILQLVMMTVKLDCSSTLLLLKSKCINPTWDTALTSLEFVSLLMIHISLLPVVMINALWFGRLHLVLKVLSQ